MARAAALALVLFAVVTGQARAAQSMQVFIVEGQRTLLADGADGAVGLLVPGAGPETSRDQALASLLRGEVRNSLRGGGPEGPPLIRLSAKSELPEPPYILVSLPPDKTQANDKRYPVAVVGPGYRGILVSDSTRIPGLVSIADIAPTALGEDDALSSQPDSDPAATLRDLDARIDDHNDSRVPAGLLGGLILIALALLWPKAGLLGFCAALLANLALGLAEVSSFWPTLVVIGLAAAAGGPLLAFVLRSDLAVGLFLAGIVTAYLVALGVDGSAVALSPFGPSQNSRFYGLSNFLETMLLVPALGGAVFLWRRLGWLAFTGLALLSFVTVAGNRFGADGGGAIVLAVAFTLLAILLAGLRGRRLAIAVGTAVAVAAGLLVLDAVTGPESHVSRALDSGPSGLAADLRDRVELSWDRIADQADIAAVVAVCLPVLVILVVRLVRSDAPLERRALPLAYAAALATSLVVNDSPNDVLTAGLVGYVVVEAVMLRDRCAVLSPSPGSSPGSPSSLPAAAPRRS
jgi:hypothetical protein